MQLSVETEKIGQKEKKLETSIYLLQARWGGRRAVCLREGCVVVIGRKEGDEGVSAITNPTQARTGFPRFLGLCTG